eukprot:SAG22_NODE_180_length_16069_cov_5.323231_12_plen_200_part_00
MAWASQPSPPRRWTRDSRLAASGSSVRGHTQKQPAGTNHQYRDRPGPCIRGSVMMDSVVLLLSTLLLVLQLPSSSSPSSSAAHHGIGGRQQRMAANASDGTVAEMSLRGLSLDSLFSFELAGISSASVLASWNRTTATFPLRGHGNRTFTRTTYFQPKGCYEPTSCPKLTHACPYGPSRCPNVGCSMLGGAGCASWGLL